MGGRTAARKEIQNSSVRLIRNKEADTVLNGIKGFWILELSPSYHLRKKGRAVGACIMGADSPLRPADSLFGGITHVRDYRTVFVISDDFEYPVFYFFLFARFQVFNRHPAEFIKPSQFYISF